MAFDLHQALNSLDLNADWVGLRQVTETTYTHYLRDAKPQANGRSYTNGLMVEVLADGQFGYAATNHLTPASIQTTAERAHRQALTAAAWGVHPFTTDVRPPATGHYQSVRQRPYDVLNVAELIDLLTQICTTLKVSEQIVRATAFAQVIETQQRFVSSNGADIEQTLWAVVADYTATAQAGNITQKRTDNGWFARCYQGGVELFDPQTVLARCERIGAQAVELLTAEDCPTTTTTLVLHPDQMMLQIHESVGHPLELDRILGDEQNYAGSSFVYLEDFGKLAYGSPLMNITFDPTVPGELASYGFDASGVPAQRQYLIRDGILRCGLGSLESQTRAQQSGVANFRASSWNRAPIDRIGNLNLEPGHATFDEIIESIEHGVYMESNRSWSIDDYRNKFQFGCEYGRLIENGKFTKTLRNPNYRGITNQFWGNLCQVGDRSTWEMFGTPSCGKGEPNQVIAVGHGSPVCAFRDIEVFGGVG